MYVSANNNNMPLPPYLYSLDFTCKKHGCSEIRYVSVLPYQSNKNSKHRNFILNVIEVACRKLRLTNKIMQISNFKNYFFTKKQKI